MRLTQLEDLHKGTVFEIVHMAAKTKFGHWCCVSDCREAWWFLIPRMIEDAGDEQGTCLLRKTHASDTTEKTMDMTRRWSSAQSVRVEALKITRRVTKTIDSPNMRDMMRIISDE